MNITTHYEFRYFDGARWLTIGGRYGRCATAEEAQALGKFRLEDGEYKCQIVMVTTTSQAIMEWKAKEGRC